MIFTSVWASEDSYPFNPLESFVGNHNVVHRAGSSPASVTMQRSNIEAITTTPNLTHQALDRYNLNPFFELSFKD